MTSRNPGMLRFFTAGESHGQALVSWISGFPAGVPVDLAFMDRELHRRQLGFGRGGRQRIEKDRADVLAGVRHGRTIGAPIAIRIEMSPEQGQVVYHFAIGYRVSDPRLEG